MISVDTKVSLSIATTLTLTEDEIQALCAIAENDTQQFINSNLSLYEDHKSGIKSLFKDLKTKVKPILDKFDISRNNLND